MSYVEEIYNKTVRENPGEKEFHQAVKEVLDSLKLVIDANETQYRETALLERLVEPERIISFRVPWVDDKGRARINKATACSLIMQSGLTKEASAFIRRLTRASLNSLDLNRHLKTL